MIRVKIGVVLLLLVFATAAQAQMFQTVDKEQAQLIQEGPGRLYCPNCGMHLVKFYKTSHAVPAGEEPARQYCSLHCLVETHAEIPAGVLVADAATFQLVPAATATYVVGSDRPGTMTPKSKYAFADPEAAAAFAAEHGGQTMDFAAAVAVARGGLPGEKLMIAGKRAAMAKKGARIHEKLCAGLELPRFASLAEAKIWLADQKECEVLDDGQLQALAIHAMSSQTAGGEAANADPLAGKAIAVPEKAKCPVCGMFVAKYPKWAAHVEAPGGREWYFDGVKDLMKFLFDPAACEVELPARETLGIRVTDHYTLHSLDARRAWYVVGSNVYGPMGKELIPFASADAAEAFLADHAGARVLSFPEITPGLVAGLDR